MMLKKLGVIMMAALISCTTLIASGCGAGAGGEVIEGEDGDKSVLFVNNYAGGFGRAWMDDIETRFEAEYAGTSFEANKMGVDIRVNHNKDQGTDYLPKLDMLNDEVFFPEKIYYYDWVKQNKMLDISDIVTGANAKDANKSIESKMTEDEKAFYKVDGKYYAIPHHEHQVGVIYDIDLFEEKSLYYAKNGAPSEKEFTGSVAYTGTGEKSAGPDGQHGTSDDGLPATYDEFFALCAYMSDPTGTIGVTPFLWNGKTEFEYTEWLLAALTGAYEGSEQIKLNYTFNGTAKNLIEIDEAGNIVELPDTPITSATGYKIYATAGRYYAIDFLKRILDGGYSYDNDYSHTETQKQYLLGATSAGTKRYAFVVEGVWWENEATDAFNEIVKFYGDEYAKTERNFGLLPLPKATSDKIGEPNTTVATDVTMGFIKAGIAPSKIELAKTFLQFCYTDESLNAATRETSLPVALKHEATPDVYAGMSSYAQKVYDMKNDIVKPYSTNEIYLNNYSKYSLIYTFKVGGKRAVNMLRQSNVTAKSYFKDLSSQYTETIWNANSDYFD